MAIRFYLTAEMGQWYIHPDNMKKQRLVDLSYMEAILDVDNTEGIGYYNENGDNMIGVFTEVPHYGWTVGAAFDEAAIVASFNQTRNIISEFSW